MIELQQVGKAFDGQPAIVDLTLTIAQGEFMVLVGGSGSGKSTTLKMINQLVPHDSGRILFQGQDVRGLAPEALRRRMGYAIQSTGLFPHWTVAQNIATVPSLLKWPAARTAQRVDELMHLLGLPPEVYRQRWPHQLSGGQQQRVGVARALAADPEVLLMDEPFGALDPLTRAGLQQEMQRIHQRSGKTIVLVTHDVDEALRLATRLALLEGGRLLQAGPPAELLARPAEARVRAFFGPGELGLQLLALANVASRMRAGESAEGLPLPADMTLREALSAFVARGCDRLPVVDAEGRPLGALHVTDLLREPPSP